MTHAFGNMNAGPWDLVDITNSSEPGKQRLVREDRLIVSVQPDGSIQTRPAGTDGPFEWCVVTGNVATFSGTGKCWPFGIAPI